MAPLPTWLQERSLNSRPISSAFASGGLLLKARTEAYGLIKRMLYERAKPGPNAGFVGGQGSREATSFNNKAYLGLFATLGAALVLACLWFFFWAKNGGFHFQEGDWDDYKSTVLRRKGPDGRTLTNATKSTKLGGSTIVGTQHFQWAKQAAKSVVSYDDKGRKGILGKRGWGKTHSVTYSDDFTELGDSRTRYDEMTEVRTIPAPRQRSRSRSRPNSRHHRDRDRDVHEYKKEKPARVGGLNRVPDGSHVDTTNTEISDVYSDNSDRPILKKNREKDKENAERRARAEAAKMERRWKKEAEEAAAALARESARSISRPKKSISPSKPSGTKQRSSSASPKKRDFSYQSGPESEILSTAQTGTTSRRTTSYLDQYRPQASDSPGYSSDYASRSRQNSPTKKKPARGGRDGGYRRGADSDLD